ncbi:protein-tyrosine-phosphatase [Kwoniella heveanensis CBS 569]|uniref:Protein-tyrosine-phosphatase n=1 Tax=Kwoniella heveanensis BCC8398 TaxID=1296120 RepID=A0A1B9GHC1_9TREE|nr:protein-tyrosine-phosphatase [Kwoniella heveanensis BCC8398]OCF38333.1 protein-tyrosine-phosphatase [Kwoniella heveanensis CBS 569]
MSSKAASGPSLIHVPNLFSIVEPGVYRCASPTAAQIPYLASLSLKTIVSLTPEHPIKPLLTFTRGTGVDFIHLGLTLWRPYGTEWQPVRDEVVKTTLEKYVLDTRAHPVLLIDPIGVHQTGCVVGALRMIQGWNFASTLVEYRAHAGSKHRYADEQYIELFDPDIVNLPPPQCRPQWWFDPSTSSASSSSEEDEEITEFQINGTETGSAVIESNGDKEHITKGQTKPEGQSESRSRPGTERDKAKGVGVGLESERSDEGEGEGESPATVQRQVDGIVPGQQAAKEIDRDVASSRGEEDGMKTVGGKLQGG